MSNKKNDWMTSKEFRNGWEEIGCVKCLRDRKSDLWKNEALRSNGVYCFYLEKDVVDDVQFRNLSSDRISYYCADSLNKAFDCYKKSASRAVLYIGKAQHKDKKGMYNRLCQYLRWEKDDCHGHKGGRALWQLAWNDNGRSMDELYEKIRVCVKPSDDANGLEREILNSCEILPVANQIR